MKIATFNVNGITARLPRVLEWLAETSPDVACLQELKTSDETFPAAALREAGYSAVWHGQKGFNGVAVLARGDDLVEVRRGLPGDPDDTHSRYLEATTHGIVIASIYLPNGNPIGSDRFAYKLAWMQRFAAHARALLAFEEVLVLLGDYNVIPEPIDAKEPEAWINDALFQPETRAAFRTLLNLGLTDAVRACLPGAGIYTFWDYQAGAWQKDKGIRIDHILASPQATDRLAAAGVDTFTRAWEKPSDHVPVWVEIAEE